MRLDQQETDARQLALAKWIGVEFYQSSKLKPLGHHSSFGVSPAALDLWYNAQLCDLAWWAVARQIEMADEMAHVIDHAWLAGYRDAAHEPWAFVTEPYVTEDTAESLAKRAQKAMRGWDVRVCHLPFDQSSWNPGRCCPIVATFEDGSIRRFFRAAVRWAMETLQ